MRLAADAAHEFGGIELDRSKSLSFRLDGVSIAGFAGDTVLSAVLAAGIDTYGTYGGTLLGLTEHLAPSLSDKRGAPLPMDRTPAIDGLELTTIGVRERPSFRRQPNSLRHILDSRLSQVASDPDQPIPVILATLQDEVERWLQRQKAKGFYP